MKNNLAGGIAAAILDSVPGQNGSCFLEIGTGSGRITGPLQESGVRLVGVDISHSKLERITRRPNLSLAQADAGQLPFPPQTFNAVITVHVMHLLDNPIQAIQEIHRVLLPAGFYFRGASAIDPHSIWSSVRQKWESLLDENNIRRHHKERSPEMVDNLLMAAGAISDKVLVIEIGHDTSPAGEIHKIRERISNKSWTAPEAMQSILLNELECWAIDEYGSLEKPYCYNECWILRRWQFPRTLKFV
ncbi:MAG: class I SAM-dependent methyltransferase [Anaerolineales bacterium]|nr:class I SAM-dependent methyltransferase [Anaerolineales bacterium]